MNRYETNLKNTSPVIDDLRNEYNKMPRGVFDLTHRHTFDASDGYIIPFDYHEMVPNSDLYLSYDIQLLSHNPTFRRLLSGASIEVRTYKRSKNDSWEGWNNFITKGRTGKVSKSIPYVDFLLGTAQDGSTVQSYTFTCTPHSPACYLGFIPPVFLGVSQNSYSSFVNSSYPQIYGNIQKLNPSFDLSQFTTGLTGISSISSLNQSTALRISALPLVMYNSICKEFWDLNLLQSNSKWVTENENHDMILPYDASGACVSSEYDNWDKPYTTGTLSPSSSNSRPYLNYLHTANKRGDYFDTGSPFPDLIRGDIPTLDIVYNENGAFDFSDSMAVVPEGQSILDVANLLGLDASEKQIGAGLYNVGNVAINTSSTALLKDALEKGKLKADIAFSMNQWRALATLTVFAERMARCDGSYNQLIEAQFGHNPKWHGHRPTFCGGFRQPLVFSEVVQQSATFTDQSVQTGTPLGTTAGRAVSAAQNPEISVHADDFCDVMSVLVIRPDEYYCQGVDKRVSRLENIEQYFPLFNNLAPDATLNKELYVSGTNTTDENVFNYQERFAYYKSRQNSISGLMSLPSSKVGSIGQYVKHRIFSNTPNFNLSFTQESEDTNMKQVYTSSIESQYVLSIGCREKFVAPIPEKTMPSDMGISY